VEELKEEISFSHENSVQKFNLYIIVHGFKGTSNDVKAIKHAIFGIEPNSQII